MPDDTGQTDNAEDRQLLLSERFERLSQILRKQSFFEHDRGFTPELLFDLVVTVFNDLQK